MKSHYHAVFFCVVVITMIGVDSFHDDDNVEYDCWDEEPEENEDTISCSGLALNWQLMPPSVIEIGEKFNVSYIVTATDSFYRDGAFFPNKTEEDIRKLCQLNNTCPEDVSLSTVDNCCIWHGNVHSCPPRVLEAGRLCGPWIGHNGGDLETHTQPQIGIFNNTFFIQDVFIQQQGLNFIFVQLSIGNVEIVIGNNIRVIELRVCGDRQCSAEIGEDCDSCPTDCCGLQFPVSATASIVVLIVVIPSTVILIILVFLLYQRRKLFYDESWIVDYADIKRDTESRVVTGSIVSMKNLKNFGGSVSELSEGSRGGHIRQIFTQTGLYKGRVVAIKKTPRQDILLHLSIRREVLRIRKLDHINLCKFIGCTLRNLGNLCIISEYCPKGSLNDVLQNDDIPLNWGFRFSFVYDIARGMAYLHSHKLYHGRLTSSNCTIDDRWVVKIADYGLPTFREKDSAALDLEAMGGNNTDVYNPPEIRKIDKKRRVPTSAGDVYSYSIVLVEVATRWDPFSSDLFIDESGRPKIDETSFSTDTPCPCPKEYLFLIDNCWEYSPSDRLTFDYIKKLIHRINPYKENPVDNMMIMMNKYSKHLEALVLERTQELLAEQDKTANLLYSMLPKPIADDLKHGKNSPPTNFECATIYFSDIVGFTTLAGASTPFQIVNLLNSLYSTFDTILDSFDAYKVETIGDAYMVVSGVPHKNKDRHAGEIARVALAFLAACDSFEIPHCPDKKLEIRAGIHSGQVCAGVVGLKMPRYCLFGDTVNTASRMESNSEAMMIHCSDATYQILKKTGTFNFKSRGDISVKGKGIMQTWWLMGEEKHSTESSATNGNTMTSSTTNGSEKNTSDNSKHPILKETKNLKTHEKTVDAIVETTTGKDEAKATSKGVLKGTAARNGTQEAKITHEGGLTTEAKEKVPKEAPREVITHESIVLVEKLADKKTEGENIISHEEHKVSPEDKEKNNKGTKIQESAPTQVNAQEDTTPHKDNLIPEESKAQESAPTQVSTHEDTITPHKDNITQSTGECRSRSKMQGGTNAL